MKRCPTCQATFGDDAAACPNDGAKLVPAPGAVTMGWDVPELPADEAAATLVTAAPASAEADAPASERVPTTPGVGPAPAPPPTKAAPAASPTEAAPAPATVSAANAKVPPGPGPVTLGWEIPELPDVAAVGSADTIPMQPVSSVPPDPPAPAPRLATPPLPDVAHENPAASPDPLVPVSGQLAAKRGTEPPSFAEPAGASVIVDAVAQAQRVVGAPESIAATQRMGLRTPTDPFAVASADRATAPELGEPRSGAAGGSGGRATLVIVLVLLVAAAAVAAVALGR
jgi:hypothetical protein